MTPEEIEKINLIDYHPRTFSSQYLGDYFRSKKLMVSQEALPLVKSALAKKLHLIVTKSYEITRIAKKTIVTPKIVEPAIALAEKEEMLLENYQLPDFYSERAFSSKYISEHFRKFGMMVGSNDVLPRVKEALSKKLSIIVERAADMAKLSNKVVIKKEMVNTALQLVQKNNTEKE